MFPNPLEFGIVGTLLPGGANGFTSIVRADNMFTNALGVMCYYQPPGVLVMLPKR